MAASRRCRAAMSLRRGLLVGVAFVSGVPAAGAAPSNPSMVDIRYELIGSGTAAYVTYQTARGLKHDANVDLPWSAQFEDWANTISAVHLVRAQGAGPGTITCVVRVGERVVSQNTATGDSPRVLCRTREPLPPRLGQSD